MATHSSVLAWRIPGTGEPDGPSGEPGVSGDFWGSQAKASRKQSSLSGKERAQGCIPQQLLGRPD